LGSPSRGTAFTDEELSLIKSEDERIRATKKALSLLSYSDNNEKALVTKLHRAGFSRDIAVGVSEEMVRLGYIDESRQLERLILREANISLSGFGKLLPKLIAKGYSSENIKKITHRLAESGEIDFKENARRLIEKKLPENASREEKKKLLYKNGYKV
jgi:SOS response regulatory protein OraA/RecX